MSIYKLIYERAKGKEITIEKGPDHGLHKDYIGSGRRNVKFANSKRIYSYTGTLIDIALRLNLISCIEVEEYQLSKGYVRCPNCGGITDKMILEAIGYCGNCTKGVLNNDAASL